MSEDIQPPRRRITRRRIKSDITSGYVNLSPSIRSRTDKTVGRIGRTTKRINNQIQERKVHGREKFVSGLRLLVTGSERGYRELMGTSIKPKKSNQKKKKTRR